MKVRLAGLIAAVLVLGGVGFRARGQVGATVGTTAYVEIAGGPMKGFWSTFPVDWITPKGTGGIELTIARSAPVGIGAFRVMTASGVSGLKMLFVDDIPTTARAAGNTSIKDAQSLTLPAAIEGAADALASHYYRFPARRGERIAFEVVARRLNSRIDPLVRLLDATGRELAYCDDTPGFGADPRFGHTFAADGQYVLELRDANYDGGADYRYRLRIGDFPAVTVPFPLGGKREAMTTFSFEAPAGDRLDPLKLKVDSPAMAQSIPLKLPGGRSSAFVTVLTGDTEDFVTSKPNHSPDAAARVTLPVNISGHIAGPGVRDFYRVAAKKGDHLTLRARTRSVGSPAMLLLGVLKPDGTKLGQSKFAVAEPKTGDATPVPDEEGALRVAIPADGDYDLVAEDLTGASGPAAVYRLDVSKADFDLNVETDKLDAPAGGAAHLKVKVARHDFDAPITLTLTGDAAKFPLRNATIPNGRAETDLTIQMPKMPSDRPLSFTVVGRTTLGDLKIVHTASTAVALKRLFPRLADPPAQFDGLIGLGVLPPKAPATTQTTRPAKK
jgi:hypothetical protein